MNKKVKYILLAAALGLVLAGAYFGYSCLSSKYQPPMPTVSEEQPQSPTDSSPQTTTLAPDFQVLNEEGETVKLSDFFGKPLVINFWATWCGPCKAELPAYDRVAKDYEGQVEFLMVNMTDGVRETVEHVKETVQEEEYSFPVYFDTTQQAAVVYGVSSVPMTVLIYADGTPAGYWIGAVDEATLEHYVKLLIKGDVHDQAES